MNLTLVSDTETEPITLAEAKAYLKVDITDDDATISGLITAARLEAENEYGRELPRKQFKLSMDAFPRGYCVEQANRGDRNYYFGVGPSFIELLAPLYVVDSFTYKKSDGTVITLVENTDYIVDTDKQPGIVCPAYGMSWPDETLWPSSAVQITFQAGFAPGTCPRTTLLGMELLTSQWYTNRVPFEAIRFVSELPYSVTSLFRNGKLWRF